MDGEARTTDINKEELLLYLEGITTKMGIRDPGVKGQESYGYEVRENGPRESKARVHREAGISGGGH